MLFTHTYFETHSCHLHYVVYIWCSFCEVVTVVWLNSEITRDSICFTAQHLCFLPVNRSTFMWLFVLQPLLQHHCSVTHTLMALFLLIASQPPVCLQRHKTVSFVVSVFHYLLSDFSQSERGLLPDRPRCVYKLVKRPNRFLRMGTFPAMGANRLYSRLRLQSAGHHSATFLIVESKCSLDTLFKRIAKQTCATRHARKWWMISNISNVLYILTKGAV